MVTLSDYEAWKSERQQAEVGAASTVLETIVVKPDEMATDLNIASEFGKVTGNPVPPAPMVREYRNVFQQKIEEHKNRTILSGAPRLTEWLRNPDNAALSRDDIENLSWFEGSASRLPYQGKGPNVDAAEPQGPIGSAIDRGLARVPQAGNQFLAHQAARRSQDESLSFSDILEDETTVRSRSGEVLFQTAIPSPYDVFNAAARYATAQAGRMVGAGNLPTAEFRQQEVGRIANEIAAMPMSEPAARFRDKIFGEQNAGSAEPGVGWLAQAGMETVDFFRGVAEDPAGFASFMGETVLEQAPMLAARAAVGIATRSPAAANSFGVSSSFLTERYLEPARFFQEKGIDISTPEGAASVISNPDLMREAAERGVLRGLPIALLDGLSGGIAGQSLAQNPVANLALQSIVQAALGGAGEAGAQLATDGNVDMREVIVEALAEFVTTPIDVATMAGSKIMRDRQNAREAEARKTLFQELSGQSVASKLRERMPDRFRQFVETATANGPVQDVYVPARQFVEYFQGIGIDPFALVDELDGVTRDDLSAALAGAGDDLRIPTATYAARLAGSEHDAFLMENMRFDPEQMTAVEAQEYINNRLDDAMEDARSEAEAVRLQEETFRAVDERIYDRVVSDLRVAGRSTDVATTEAAPMQAFYRTMPERMGMTPDEFLAAYPVPQVVGDVPQGMQPKNVDEFTRTLAELRSRRAKADTRPTLLDFISDYGGINDPGGELRARDADVIKRGRGKKTLRLRRSGMKGIRDMFGAGDGKRFGMDDVALAAIESGFMSDNPTVIEYKAALERGDQVPDIGRALLEAIDEELRGTPQLSDLTRDDAAAVEAERLDEIEEYLKRLGVSVDDDDAAIRAAVESEDEGRRYAQASNRGRETSTGPDGRTALFDRGFSDWRRHAERIISGTAESEFTTLRESSVLASVVGGKGAVKLRPIIANAIRARHPDIPARVWHALPVLLSDPAFVFTRADGRAVAIVNAVTENGSSIAVGIGDGEIETITPWDGSEGETSRDRLARELGGAIGRKGAVYIKDQNALAQVPIRTGLIPWNVRDGSPARTYQGKDVVAKITTRDDVVKSAGRIFYQDLSPRGSIQFPSAGIGNGDTIIRLFERANLSTFLHESGHYFLTVMQDMAGKGIPQAVQEFETVKAWWGENAAAVAADAMITADDVLAAIQNGTTGDTIKDAAVDVGMQEQFARGFEAYLLEGKAPSVELRSAFEKFRAWLISVYRSLAGLNVSVSPELGGVFDRMLASDAQIAEAQSSAGGAANLFATAEEMGLTDEQFAQLQTLRMQAEDEAKSRLLREVMEPIKRERDKAYRDEKKRVREEAEREVNAYRVYRAYEWLGNGRWLGDDEPIYLDKVKLSRSVLVQRYGEGVLKTLSDGRKPVYAVEGGIDPDEAAGWFGFKSGDELVRAIEQAPRRRDAINAETEKRMRDLHGDMLNDGTIEAAAVDVVHNDKRGQWIAAELQAVSDVAGVDVALTAKQARATARDTLNRMRVRDAVAANRFLVAERKAGDEAARLGAMLAREGVWMQNARRKIGTAARAALRGDAAPDAIAPRIERANASTGNYNKTVTRLIEAKRRQLLNHALYMESRKIADEVEKAERFVAKLNKKTTRDRIAGAGRRENANVDYLAAIDELTERYDFRRMSGRQEDRRGSLLAYVEAMKAAGRENELAIPDAVLQTAARTPYKTLSVEELRGVVDALKNLEHAATRWSKLIDAKRQRDFEEDQAGIVEAIRENIGSEAKPWVKQEGVVPAAKEGLTGYLSSFTSATTVIRQMDGRKDLGVAYEALKAGIDDASYTEREMRKEAATKIEELYSVYSREEQRQMGVRRLIPELRGQSFSKWNLIAMALNMGNEGNLQRLTNDKASQFLTPAEVEIVKGMLDERDARFVQSVWDYLNSFRPLMSERQRRVVGTDPKWVDGDPVTIGGVALRGGYYPIKYDGEHGGGRTNMGETDADILQSMMSGGIVSASTKDGHLKARSATSGQTLKLDVSVIGQHVSEVIHDLTFSEPVVNSFRLLTSRPVADAMLQANMKRHHDMLKLWLVDAASGQLAADAGLSAGIHRLRTGFAYSKLAFSIKTMLLQPLGIFQSAVAVGKVNMARQSLRYLANPKAMSEDVFARSRMMWERRETFNKDLMDVVAQSNIASPSRSAARDVMDEWVIPGGMAGMQYVQLYSVDIPTWAAAFQKGIKQFDGDEDKAARYADMTVQRTQGSGVWSDRSAIERGTLSLRGRQNPFVTLMTTLGSYFFAKMNMMIERTQGLRAEPVTVRAAMDYALDMMLMLTAEAAVIALLDEAWDGAFGDDEDDDDEWLLGEIGIETFKTAIAGLPVIRDVAGMAAGFSPGTYASILGTLYEPLRQIAQGEADKAAWKSVINVGGMLFRLPSAQTNRLLDAAWREAEGEDVAPVEYILGRPR